MGNRFANSITLADWSIKLVSMADALSVGDGGFSVDSQTGEDARAGFAVAVHPEHERVVTSPVGVADLIAYLVDVAHVLALPGRVFGGWRDPQTDTVYLDVSAIVSDYSDAVSLARKANQVAVFDLAAGESVRVECAAYVV